MSAGSLERTARAKHYILFDHDGVLVDTERWYFTAGQRALAGIGLTLDEEQYLRDMSRGLGTWVQARAAGVDEATISAVATGIDCAVVRNDFTQGQDFSGARYRIEALRDLKDIVLGQGRPSLPEEAP